MMNETISEITEEIKQRSRSYLIGPYIVTWIVVNIELFYHIFTVDNNVEYSERVDYILDHILDNYWITWLMPLAITLIKIFILDWFIIPKINEFYHKIKKRTEDGKAKIDNQGLIIQLQQEALASKEKEQLLRNDIMRMREYQNEVRHGILFNLRDGHIHDEKTLSKAATNAINKLEKLEKSLNP